MSKTEKILFLKNEIEARLLDDVLTERNIPHILRSYHDSAYDGLFQYQSGWGHIEAPAECREEILEIYKSLSS
jgi:hypothetical protein